MFCPNVTQIRSAQSCVDMQISFFCHSKAKWTPLNGRKCANEMGKTPVTTFTFRVNSLKSRGDVRVNGRVTYIN